MRVLVLAEDYHAEPVKAIVRLAGVGGVRVISMRGNRVQKLVGYIRHHPEYDKFVMLKDQEHYDEETVRRRFREARERALRLGRGIRIEFVVVRRAVEAWILADPDAIERALGCNVGGELRRGLAEPEEIERPKEVLADIIRKCGRIYSHRLVAKIAEHLNLDVTRRRASSLDEFLNAISDP